jgi:hypothetical protein
MRIYITKLTDVDLLRQACKLTTHGQTDSMMSLDKIYRCEHSPCRTQLFWIELLGIPTSVSVHLVRHKIGVEHFVQTMRDDRGADAVADRNTPVNHGMLINAQELINIARKRLCMGAHAKTRLVVESIKDHLKPIDPDLTKYMVPECTYRGDVCHELKPCGRILL